MYEAAAGFLRPEVAIRAHLELAVNYGAELHFREPVEAWSAALSGEGVTVKTAVATYQAARLVIAPGAWASDILSDLRIPFDVRRHVMCWFQPLSNLFQPDKFPIYIWDVDGVNCFYGFPQTEEGVKAAMHSGGATCTAQTVNREVLDTDIDEVRHYLERFIPTLNRPCVKAAACMYTLTQDEHFVVSLHPSHPQVSVAAGFSGHGFKFSCVMGEILADLALDGKTSDCIDFLSATRFG